MKPVDESAVELSFRELLASPAWREMSCLPIVTDTCNLFSILDHAVCENSWSRVLGFLFDSNEGHDLDMRPLRIWLSSAKAGRFTRLAQQAVASSTSCEWGTGEMRRLDILIKLLDQGGRLKAVIGIENKVWSGEQWEQLSDYQKALCEHFRGVPKLLIFLTPDKRVPQTSDANESCHCHPCSYTTLVTMCKQLQRHAREDVKLLLSSLGGFINRKIVMESLMSQRTEKIVRKLYQNKQHRQILETIFEHRPTLQKVRGEIEKSVKDYVARSKTGGEWWYSQWPMRADSPPEMKIGFDAHGDPKDRFGIEYMLRCPNHDPFIGDSFTMLIAAWCNTNAAKRRVQDLKIRLPRRVTHNFKNWASWHVIWEGDTYRLQDLGERDAKNLARLVVDTIKKTYRPLLLAVSRIRN
jgi:hypothetical protein